MKAVYYWSLDAITDVAIYGCVLCLFMVLMRTAMDGWVAYIRINEYGEGLAEVVIVGAILVIATIKLLIRLRHQLTEIWRC